MNVSHFNTFPYGGAAYAARRIHEGLVAHGMDSTFFYWKNERDNLRSDYQQIEFLRSPEMSAWQRQMDRMRQRKIKRSYDKHIRQRDKTLEVFSGAKQLDKTVLDWNQINANVLHLHWLAFMVDYPSFFQSISNHVPVVWTLHDMNPFTGGCHYSSGCQRFERGCGSCPQLVHPLQRDESMVSFKAKQNALHRKNLSIVAPSNWMLNLAKKSPVFADAKRFELIPYGFDLTELKPIAKPFARKQLGINDLDSVVIGFGAEDITQRRKGLHLLIQSLTQLSVEKPVTCLVFGTGQLPMNSEKLPPIHPVGFVHSQLDKALVYSAMDLFVMPSLEDNSPQTGLEAMACGTPVVAFNIGGIPEYVKPNQTGLLSPVGDTAALAENISWLVNYSSPRLKMSELAREFMLQHHTLEQQTEKYIQLYQLVTGLRFKATSESTAKSTQYRYRRAA
ncbi:MAG TPA: glycosyltransferase [Pirellulaceae bacterium]|nr:glycosyltransferase [Pirellulaceae bacterium]HMO92042.1 glycosyltransferase [Pirellulaceae bacterium]HMP68841.1 glycosyltransferase [Pirellulaceae bacterium]